MGFVREVKANVAKDHATRALREGRSVLLYRQNVPATASSLSGPVAGVAEVVEAIEAQGWRLVDMAFDGSQNKNGAVMLLFRPAAPYGQRGAAVQSPASSR